MSKFIALTILVSLTLLPVTGNKKSTVAPDTPMKVTIEFGGLMVFNEHRGNFEVGILLDRGKHGHKFCIKKGNDPKICRKELEQKYGPRWSFIVENTTPTANTYTGEGHGGVRRPDDEQGQYDFDWIIQLDGPEFHTEEPLELEPGHLRPIIKLPNGAFFTKYKSHDFVRWQGKKPKPHQPPPPAFGFVSEAIGLRVTLNPGQRLVLRDDRSRQEIIAVDYMAGVENYDVKVANVRPKDHRKKSDFRMYYKLFRNLKNDIAKQYDFDQNKHYPCPQTTGNRPCKAYNLVPTEDYSKKTCCSLWCTQVLLRNLNGNLQ